MDRRVQYCNYSAILTQQEISVMDYMTDATAPIAVLAVVVMIVAIFYDFVVAPGIRAFRKSGWK